MFKRSVLFALVCSAALLTPLTASAAQANPLAPLASTLNQRGDGNFADCMCQSTVCRVRGDASRYPELKELRVSVRDGDTGITLARTTMTRSGVWDVEFPVPHEQNTKPGWWWPVRVEFTPTTDRVIDDRESGRKAHRGSKSNYLAMTSEYGRVLLTYTFACSASPDGDPAHPNDPDSPNGFVWDFPEYGRWSSP